MDSPARPQSWSHPATSKKTFQCLDELDWSSARVADVGAGRGHFSHLMGEYLREQGLEPSDHIFPSDLIPESYEYEPLTCQVIEADGRLPYADNSMDAAVSIEVIEHVENQFAFVRELVRVVKPGGIVIITTPNTLNSNSRLRNLTWGFPVLFDPLPLDEHDPRLLGGHIHPISPYFLGYNALRCGLSELEYHGDRVKSSGAGWAILIKPLLWIGHWFCHSRLRRKHPTIARDNAELIRQQASWPMLVSRTVILKSRVAKTAG